jgi:hypothetical protein
MEARTRPERRQALQEAKQAVRAYAREPSQTNPDAVEMAWRKVRQLDSVAQWRQTSHFDQGADPDEPSDSGRYAEQSWTT